jgi:NADH-quinone oxidoreductase subunit E
MNSHFNYEAVDRIVNEWGAKESSIIAILEAVQEEYRFIPPEVFPYLAKKLKVSEARIYSVATFYENFSLVPKGKFVIKVCNGTACHVRNSEPILNALRKALNVSEENPTTPGLEFTVETVSCLGACGLAPVLTVNDEVHPSMTPEKALALVNSLEV